MNALEDVKMFNFQKFDNQVCFIGLFQEMSANHNGEMRLRVETEQVTVSVNFKDLEVVHVGEKIY